MPVADTNETQTRRKTFGVAVVVVAVLAPLALLAVLRLRPALDGLWQNHPAHFWLVLAAAVIATALGSTVTAASRRRRDARLFMVSMAFIAAAGGLGLHALATPGVLLGPNAGFELATPVGLVVGGVFAALSAIELSPTTAQRIMARSRLIMTALFALIVVWAVLSVAQLPPLADAVARETLGGWQLAFAVVGVLGYTAGAWGYLRLYQRRGTPIVLAFAVAFALLAAALVVLTAAVNWRLSWWEWHVLMLAAFGLIAGAARQEWHEERFSALYLQHTLDGTSEASILFADLQGFTPYSERTEPQEVQAMLNVYFARLIPLMQQHGGAVHQLIGDAIMVVFNKHGGQPDHARLAAGAALAFQEVATEVAAANPDWPRFRVGVNSGAVAAGVVGERGHRKHDFIGDTVNLAARLESQAPVGGVLIGEGTRASLPEGVVVEALPPLQIKGKAEPVTAYVLHHLPA
ncbi:MAG: adenylate/guanylate cyclase domain-containing protein [Egibacteraceae bacterium]